MLPPQRIPLSAIGALPALTDAELEHVREEVRRLAAPCLAVFTLDVITDGRFTLAAYGSGGTVHVAADAPVLRVCRSFSSPGEDIAESLLCPALCGLPWDELRVQAAEFPAGAIPGITAPLLRALPVALAVRLIREAWVRVVSLRLDGDPEAARRAEGALEGEVRDALREAPWLAGEDLTTEDRALAAGGVTLEELASGIGPGQHEQALAFCAAVARHGGMPAERARLVRMAGWRSGLGPEAAVAALRRAERRLDTEIDEHLTDVPGQRLHDVLPDFPGPDLQLPWAYRIHPDGRVSRRRAAGWQDLLLAPVVPAETARDPQTGRYSLTCWVRPEPGAWERVTAPRADWFEARRLGRLLRRAFGQPVTTRAGTGKVAAYLADMEIVAMEQVELTGPGASSR